MRISCKSTVTLIILNSLRSTSSFQIGSKRSVGNTVLQNKFALPSQAQNIGVRNMATFATTSTGTETVESGSKFNFTWQQVMLRIKDPKQSVPFYENQFGFKLIHFYNFPQWNFSLYFLAFIPEEESFDLVPGTIESEKYLWSCQSK